MKDQHRTVRVISALVVGMTIGSFVLMLLDNQSLSAGTFSLDQLSRLAPVRTEIAKGGSTADWDGIEVYYNDGSVFDFEKLVRSSKSQLHFAIGNPAAGKEGVIKQTAKWKNQKPCPLDIEQGQKIIRICIINDAGKSHPTNCQVSRTTELVETLSRLHNISPVRIRYPVNWQL
ncbi:MAG: hypothetical protein FVQ82_14090 [Planctomycetes bacterium]|nr:hypothetical protein [Planctomycetota bacterium]